MSKRTKESPGTAPSARLSRQHFSSPAVFGVSPLLHFLQLSAHLASFQYLTIADNPISSSFGWHFQYLTIFGLLFSTITAALGSASDLLSPFEENSTATTSKPPATLLSSASSTLYAYQKSILFGAAAPLELLIFALYWSLRFIDKDLVVPPWAQMPVIPDLSFHLVPAVCLTFDALFLSPPPRFTPLQGLLIASTLALAYYPWVSLCHFHNGYWPYTLFELVGPYGRIGLHVLSALSMAANYSLLRWCYMLVNGNDISIDNNDDNNATTATATADILLGNPAEEKAKLVGAEPDALRKLRESVNGAVKRTTGTTGKSGGGGGQGVKNLNKMNAME